METSQPLTVQSESLRYYLAGFIYVMVKALAEEKFVSPTTIEVDTQDKGITYLTTRSGTKSRSLLKPSS